MVVLVGGQQYLHHEVSEQCEVDARPAVEQSLYLDGTHRPVLLALQLIDALRHVLHRAQSRRYDVTVRRVAMVMTQHVLHRQQQPPSIRTPTVVDGNLGLFVRINFELHSM